MGPAPPGVLLACDDSRRAVAAFHAFAAWDRGKVPERLRFLGHYAMENPVFALAAELDRGGTGK